MYIEINNKQIWPYKWIMNSQKDIKWDILPIIYDNAQIELFKNQNKKYSLWYKTSSNLLWKDIKYADIIDEVSWETFSFQVKNIFFAKIINDDLKVIALVWDEIKIYENFWKSQKFIEIDWDKKDITPLWYYDMFVSYDYNYFYPLILTENTNKNYEIKRFYDYYWYRAYIDESWENHLYMLIEDEKSTEIEPSWYFIDNFNIISEKLDFDWDNSEYVEEWNINENWDIYMETTSWKKWYLDKQTKKIILWDIPNTTKKSFSYTRIFEDTDCDYIVWKNESWFFIIDRTKSIIKNSQIKLINFYTDFLFHTKFNDQSYFLMKNIDHEIVLADQNWVNILTTDLDENDKINHIKIEENLVEIKINDIDVRKFLI